MSDERKNEEFQLDYQALLDDWTKSQKRRKNNSSDAKAAELDPKTSESSKKPTGESFKEKRSRCFSCNSYIDVNALDRFLTKAPWVSHWAYCTHDKDIDESSGELKTPHTHILLYTYEAKTSSAVRKLFDRYSAQIYAESDLPPQNTLVTYTRDPVFCYRYLLHLDDPDKHLYELSCRHVDNKSYWQRLEKTAGMNDFGNNVASAIFRDVCNHVPIDEMIDRYGQNYVINAEKYQRLADRKTSLEFNATRQSTQAMVDFVMMNCPYKKTEINMFYDVLHYLKSEFLKTYDSDIEFCIKDK